MAYTVPLLVRHVELHVPTDSSFSSLTVVRRLINKHGRPTVSTLTQGRWCPW